MILFFSLYCSDEWTIRQVPNRRAIYMLYVLVKKIIEMENFVIVFDVLQFTCLSIKQLCFL